MTSTRWTTATVVALLALTPRGSAAQIGATVEATDRGTVRFSYEARPGVEICDRGIRFRGNHMMWRSLGSDRSPGTCTTGLVTVELEVRNGVVQDVEVVTERKSSGRARDLGRQTAGEAAGYLVSLAYRGATRDGAEDAIMPAMLADVDGTWREVLEVARDRSLPESVRKSALFWIGQEAAEAVVDGLAGVATDSSEDQEVRNSAVFALSQRDDDEAIPVLIEIAETAEQLETRKTAMFWLAQSDDPRVIQFFEDILLRKGF